MTEFHHLDIYDVDLHLATSRRQWASLRRRLTFLDQAAPESLGFAHFAVWHPRGAGRAQPVSVFYIPVDKHASIEDLVNTCSHEASHGAGQILDWIGYDITGVSEPHAYLVGWLTTWLWRHTQELVSP